MRAQFSANGRAETSTSNARHTLRARAHWASTATARALCGHAQITDGECVCVRPTARTACPRHARRVSHRVPSAGAASPPLPHRSIAAAAASAACTATLFMRALRVRVGWPRRPSTAAHARDCPPRFCRRRARALRVAVAAALAALAALSLLALLRARGGDGGGARASTSADVLHATGATPQLRALLARVAARARHEHDDDERDALRRVVLLFAADCAYTQLALNLAYNLRRVRVRNYLAFALDARAYRLLLTQGVNVFLFDHFSAPPQPQQQQDATFGSQRFVRTSRQKSRLVLQVLRLGYHVLFCDVDVVLRRNPLSSVLSSPADIVIQSDRAVFQPLQPLNYNLNSGLYLARSNARTIAAFDAITRWAVALRRSEQKAFNYVLCGAFKDHVLGPGARVGPRRCVHTRSRASVQLLSLEQFPNGSNHSFWQLASPSLLAQVYARAVALHLNYVTGVHNKLQRLRHIGACFVDTDVAHLPLCSEPYTRSPWSLAT